MPAATDHYRQSIDLLTKLTADYPAMAQYRAELARSHRGLGKLHKRRGERGAAEESFRQALDIQIRLSSDFPAVMEYRADLAQIHRLLGYWPEGSGWLPNLPEQVDHERQACKILNDLVAEFPAVALHRYRLASTLQELATYAGPFTQRNEFYNQAIPILTKLVADSPQVPEYRSALCVCYGNHGANYLTSGDWETAAKYLRMSLDLSTKLAAECPSVTHFSGQLATGTVTWAEVLIYRGELAQARKSLEDAITRLRGCLDAQPKSPYYAQMLAIANYLLSIAIAPLGEAAEAAKRHQDAEKVVVETGRRLLKVRGPFVAAQFCVDVATELGIVAEGLKKKGRHQELNTVCEAAIKALSKAVELDPTFAKAWTDIAIVHYRAGEWKEAIAVLGKSMELRNGGDSFDWFFLAKAHWQLGDKEQARKSYDQAVRWMDKNKPQDEELRRFRAEAAALLKLPEPPRDANVPKKEEKRSQSKR